MDKPYTFENSSNPWLMDKKHDDDVIIIDNHKLTAKYMWSLNTIEREELLDKVFAYYRSKGFPYPKLSEDDLLNKFYKLIKFDINKVIKGKYNGINYISNAGYCCIDVCHHFTGELFYSSKGSPKTMSVKEVFDDDELFRKVLQNRMGWNTTLEDAENNIPRPYLFPISDNQILKGAINSGLAYRVSNFRPSIAKWMYLHAIKLIGLDKIYNHNDNGPIYNNINIFDISAGWGARALSAISLGCTYHGTDPYTALALNDLLAFYKVDCSFINPSNYIYNKCSEDKYFQQYQFYNKYHIIGGCPPYFELESYGNDPKQSIISCNHDYKRWLDEYWSNTIENSIYMMTNNGIFILVINDKLRDDMQSICINKGLELIEEYTYITSVSHLSNKANRHGNKTPSLKHNEYVLFFKKKTI